jgi:hypothetical protein
MPWGFIPPPPPPPPPPPAPPVETLLPTLLAVAACWIIPALYYYLFTGDRSASTAPAPPVVGSGYCSEPITGVGEDAVWAAMVSKIKMPDKFLPVDEVSTLDKRSAAGPYIWRTMRFKGAGPLTGTVIVEHIYAERETGEIRFVILDPQCNETDEEIVNAMHTSPLRIEYFKRSVSTKKRIHFPAPRISVISSISKTVELAKASESAEASGPAKPAKSARPPASPRR